MRVNLQILHQIVVDAASAHSVEEQVERLVSQVRDAMSVSACSLYQRFEDNNLCMVANRGFNPESVGKIILPIGKGLVGLIAQDRLPLNLPVASEHPSFQFFPDSGEQDYPSFMGVPIIHLGMVNGVLVVQDRYERIFSDDELSFLMTIAAQLGPNLMRLHRTKSDPQDHTESTIRGISASPGKCVGFVHLVVNDQTLQFVDEPKNTNIEQELSLLASAVECAEQDIDQAKAQIGTSVSTNVLELFDFYKAILSADQLVMAAENRIRNGVSAFAAVRSTIDEYVHAFDAIQDEYLRSRGEDIRHIGNKLLTSILGKPAAGDNENAQKVILLGSTVSITEIASFRPEQLAGIICLQGSSLSHTAVLARSLGIPAVVGTGSINKLHEGVKVIIDGDSGSIFINPADSIVQKYEAIIAEDRLFQDDLLEQKELPATTTDSVRITLLANTGLLSDALPGKLRGAEGIGLYRSEIPFLAASSLPSETEQYELYRALLKSYHPLPVAMRTLDIGGDKPLSYLPMKEDNPALGWRGIRFTIDNPAILFTQLKAMLRANEGLGNLRITLPMVGNLSEIVEVKRILQSITEKLVENGFRVTVPPLGIMLEIPGIIPLLPHLAEHIDFLSVGTNDLTQYLLAVDRNNSQVAMSYDYLHPSVLHALAEIIRLNKNLKLPVSICGEMAADPLAVALLIGLGYRSLSMNAFSLPKIKALIRRLSIKDASRLAGAALKLADAHSIRSLVDNRLRQLGLGSYLPSASIPIRR